MIVRIKCWWYGHDIEYVDTRFTMLDHGEIVGHYMKKCFWRKRCNRRLK